MTATEQNSLQGRRILLIIGGGIAAYKSLDLIRRVRENGAAVVVISHRMPDVFAVCDRIVVLRRGRKVADKAIAASSPEEVTGLITGAIEQVL